MTSISKLPWEDASGLSRSQTPYRHQYGEKKGATTATAKKGNGATKVEEENIDALAELTLVDVLSAQDSPISRVRAGVLVSQVFAKTDPEKAKSVSRKVADKVFVAELSSVVYDANKDTLALA